MKLVIILGAAVISGVITYLVLRKRKENYGAMKNIKQIPFNECSKLCSQYREKCVSDNLDADPTWCDRMEDACISECYYTPYHRLPG